MSTGEEEEVAIVAASGVLVKEMRDEMTASGEPVMEDDAMLEGETTQTHVAGRAEMSVEDEVPGKTENEKPMMDASKIRKEEEEEEADEGVTRFRNGESYIELKTHDYYHTLQEDIATHYRDEGVTRFGNGESYIELKTHDYYHTLQEDVEAHYKDVVFGGEYESLLRPKPFREMSVIEEEGEEGTEEPLSKSVVEFADGLTTRVLGEAFLEVGMASDKVTTAWEEMTFREFVHRREGKQHRQLYKTISMPPENELMKGSERQLSEAELRVRRSLQRLDVPEWMKNAPPPQQGFLLRRRDYGSSSAPAGGWSAYSSKTASMTSLGSSRAVTPNTPTKVVIPTRVATRGVGGVGGVTSPASNCSISPSPSDRSGSLFQYPISRWSTSRLNSGTTTPTGSVTSSRTTATYTRQPYLGWRSQTSLANLAGSQSSLTSTGSYLTAADRLALGITAYSQRFVKPTPSTQDKENSSSEANAAAPKPENPEQNDTGSTNGSIKLQVPTDVADVHSSIKEVTSAIVHYCNESTPSPRASPRGSPRPDGRAPSPRRLVWVESSFVGSRPITSPETPTSSTHAITPTSQLNGHDLPESGEVPSRPPQPPEVVSLVNSLSSACSSLRDSSRDSTAASTNDSTAVIVDSSLGGDSSRADSRHSFSDSGQSTVDRSTVDSRHSTADTVNSGLSSRNIDSLNSRSSVLSSRSSGECSSRGSVGSSSRSSSSRAGGSRDDIEASPGSGEADDLAGRPSVGMFEDDLPVSVSASSTLVVRPALHPSAPRSSPVVLSTFQGTNNEVFQFGAATHEESRRSSEASGGVTEGMGRERHTVAYGEAVGYDELFKSEESGDELFTDHYGTTEPDPHNLGPDSTTLEDVLDSLLALPSASRSPSPVCGHHPLGRPFSHPGYTKSHQEKDNTLPSSPQSLDCPPKHQDDHYGSLRNHNLPTDCKPDGYHKSFSYSSSSGESSFQQQQQQAGARPLLHQQHPPPPPEGSPVSFFLARDEGEPHSEPPTTTTTTTTTTHTPSRARTAQSQSHVHVDPSGRAPTTRRLDTLEAQGPEGTFTARQVTEADPSTGVLLHQSTAVVTHPHSHAYSAAPIPPAHTNLSQNAHISPTHHPRLSSPTSDSLISHRILQSSSSHNIVPPTPPSYTTPTTASRHVNTTFTHPIHSLSSTLPNCVITASPVPINSHHTTLPQSHSRSAPSDTRPSHPPASSPRAGTSPGHTTRSNLHKGHHQPHVPGHFVPDSQGSGQVNQLGTSPPKRSSQEVVPASPADPLTEALMLSGVIAAVPSIVERQPPPPPPAGPRVTFHLPPRHMNIPPDSSSENGNGNENVRVDADDDSTSSNIVKCRNPSCGLTAETDEARSTFKTCHNCSTFYCSRACRRQHWERHKKQCKRISSLAVAKQVVARVREDEAVLERVSAVARRGIRALGRGTVKIFFHDIRGAETFVGGGELPETHYMTIQNLLPQETGPEVYKQITELCKHYNVEYKLVLYVSICIMNEIPTGSSPKWEREMVSHCAKLRLAGGTGGGGSDTWSPRPERHVITRDMDEPETMILTSAPIPESNTSPQAARHIAFNNIVRHLREKGISLRHQYPDVHKKLTAYVELGEVFPPLTIYPRDVTTGSTFMCIIMPETDHAKLQLLSNDASKVRTIDISRPHPPA